MEKELLQKALDSILHGSTQIVSETDGNGDIRSREIRINDLRIPLIKELARYLSQTPEFKKALENIFTAPVIEELKQTMLAKIEYRDLPYDLKNRLEKEMKDTGLTVRKYKVVAEAVEE